MKYFYLLIITAFSTTVFGQEFVNGSFEENPWVGTGTDWVDMEQALINLGMDGVYSAGTEPNIDMITSSGFAGGPQDGNYFAGLSGGGTDMMALEVEPAFQFGIEYAIIYFDKKHPSFESFPLVFGISDDDLMFGDTIHHETVVATPSEWTVRYFVFTSTANAAHLTMEMDGGDINSWIHVDNFQFGDPATIQDMLAEPVRVFPNPAENFLYVDNQVSEISSYRVFNIMGQVVQSESMLNARELMVDISELNVGNYVIEIEYGDKSLKRTRFIKN